MRNGGRRDKALRRSALWAGLGLGAVSLLWAAPAPSVDLGFPDNPLHGRTLFENKSCIQCHGLAGRGPSIGPSLGGGRFKDTFLGLGAALWNHAPAMSATFEITGIEWPRLSPEEAGELVGFLYFIDYLGRPGDPVAGERLFRRARCSVCHSVGAGPGSRGPDLSTLERHASPLAVAQEIWNHGPAMFESMRAAELAPPVFEAGNLADLSAYIRSQAANRARTPLLSEPGNPNRGKTVFASKGCASCHGREGRGGDVGADLSRADLSRSAEAIAADMWNHGLAMNEAMAARGLGWPKFKDSELADLTAFLYFLPFVDREGDPDRGAQVFRERTCADCHASSAQAAEKGLIPGPALEESEAAASATGLVAAMWNHAPLMKKAILGHGRPWPELDGADLRDLRAFLERKRRETGR